MCTFRITWVCVLSNKAQIHSKILTVGHKQTSAVNACWMIPNMQIKLETHQIYLTWQVKCLLYKIDSIDAQNQVRVEAENQLHTAVPWPPWVGPNSDTIHSHINNLKQQTIIKTKNTLQIFLASSNIPNSSLFVSFFSNVYAYLCTCKSVQCSQNQNRGSECLKLELLVVRSHSALVLGIKLGSSAKAVRLLTAEPSSHSLICL